MYRFSFYLLVCIVVGVFIIPLIYTVSPYDLNPDKILLAPNLEHIMGTDRLGRDLFARILNGGQTSLIIGFLSAAIASLIGLIVGISAGYFRGNYDKTITIIIDLFLTFPTFFLLLALVSYMEASILILIIVLFMLGFIPTPLNILLLLRENILITFIPIAVDGC